MQATIARIGRIVQLDLSVFDEVRFDSHATVSSLAVATGTTFLFGLGGWLWWTVSGLGDGGAVFVKSVVLGTLFSLVLWLVWLLVVYTVLLRIAHVAVPVEQLVRSAGLATAPLALGMLMVVPAISFGIGLVAIAGWVLMTQVAIERSTGISGGAVTIANAAGFAVWAIVMSLLATSTSQLAPGPFLAESIWEALTSLEFASQVVGS
jgi:hypothetical protein